MSTELVPKGMRLVFPYLNPHIKYIPIIFTECNLNLRFISTYCMSAKKRQ